VIDSSLLRDLGMIVLGATLVALLARTVRIPSIVAYLVAGLLLGPGTGLVELSEGVTLISEVGIALLLFVVGLELSLEKIRDVGRVAIVAGLGQVVFTALGGLLLCLLLGFGWIEGFFIATALTFSSTVIVVKLLDQKGELDSTYGRIAVGIFLVQDLVVIVALTFLSGLGRPDELAPLDLALGVGRAFLGMGFLLGLAYLAARWLLPRLFGWVSASSEALFIWALAWCFLLVLGAELLHLSLEIGAFLAGVTLAQLPFHGELRRRAHPLMNFFIAVFFVSLGVQIELGSAATVWWPALLLSLFVLIGNPLIFLVIIGRMGYPVRTAFLTSVTVAQISEFSFVLAAMGLSAGLIPESTLSLIGIIGFVTIGLSAYMILYNHWLFERIGHWRLLRWLAGEAEEVEEAARSPVDGSAREGHVIVIGMNSLGRRIVRELHTRGEQVLAIDTDPEKLRGLPCWTLLGNAQYLSVLEEAGLRRARLVVSALRIEEMNRLIAYRARTAGIPAVIHSDDMAAERELMELGVTRVLSSREAGVRKILEALHHEGVTQR